MKRKYIVLNPGDLKLAKEVVKEPGKRVSAKKSARLAQLVLDLAHQIDLDEGAIAATLEKCDGHITLAVLINYYNTYKKGWQELREIRENENG